MHRVLESCQRPQTEPHADGQQPGGDGDHQGDTPQVLQQNGFHPGGAFVFGLRHKSGHPARVFRALDQARHRNHPHRFASVQGVVKLQVVLRYTDAAGGLGEVFVTGDKSAARADNLVVKMVVGGDADQFQQFLGQQVAARGQRVFGNAQGQGDQQFVKNTLGGFSGVQPGARQMRAGHKQKRRQQPGQQPCAQRTHRRVRAQRRASR